MMLLWLLQLLLQRPLLRLLRNGHSRAIMHDRNAGRDGGGVVTGVVGLH